MDDLNERLERAEHLPDEGSLPSAAELNALFYAVRQAHPARRRFSTRALTGLLVGGLVIGGASTAVAAPAVVHWLGWEPDASNQVHFPSGDTCTASFAVRQDFASPFDDAPAAAAAAKEYLRTLDLSTLPVADTMASMRAEGLLSDSVPVLQAEKAALSRAVVSRVGPAVAAQGYKASFAIQGEIDCDSSGDQ